MEGHAGMIKFALATIGSGLSAIEGVIGHLCASDHEVAKSVADLYRRVENVYKACGGTGLKEAVARMLDEIAKCQDMDCVRSLVEEYKAMLFGGGG